MSIPIELFEKQLEDISEHEGVAYGRAHLLFNEEEKHGIECLQYKGYLSLSDAFKCHFLLTVELLNIDIRPKITTPLSELYALFIPRLVHSFKSLCGCERLALRGYPYHSYALLRNTLDNNILTSAVFQGITDFYSIEGIEVGKQPDAKSIMRLRKDTEYEVRRNMTGTKSGLSTTTIDELKKWDAMFDYEVHGARLSLADSTPWIKGSEPLPVLPEFSENSFAIFMNRYCEIAWMTHRLIPMIQPSGTLLDDEWHKKWIIIDQSFETMVNSLTKQLKKNIGAAVVELVQVKFPYNEKSSFSLS